MTVSHMFVNRRQVNCSVNYEVFERNQKLERPDENLKIGYNTQDSGFKELVKAIVLGTYTVFSYDPSDDDCKALYARMQKVPVTSIKGDLKPEIAKEMRARLIAAE
jgi:hypothetical protein